jgi:hypothetical protein
MTCEIGLNEQKRANSHNTPTELTGMPALAAWSLLSRSKVEKAHVRLILLVGLPARLEDRDAFDTPKSKGTPSRMSSCFPARPFTGSGICDSGPLAE